MNFTDQTGENIEVESTNRVVSLVPSQTEFLHDIGLANRLVGCTKFCVHPKGLIEELGHCGGTKNLNIEKILALKPDFVIGNKEENTKEEIEELRKHVPVWLSDIYTFEDAIDMMQELGSILKLESESNTIVHQIQSSRSSIKSPECSVNCLYFIWRNPNMVVGADNFIDSMIREAGFKNIGIELGSRYPELIENQLNVQPDVVFLSTEPYPFDSKHIEEFKELFPDSNIEIVDGEMFSWYGSRLMKSYKYFSDLRGRLFK